jgi:threonine/homoserine/homoserine lactone efflux protein
MIGEGNMATFILVVLVLFLVPGPAVVLTVSQTLKGGKMAGMMTGAGIACGDLMHAIASVLGLSAILMTSALAFEMIKYMGAAYLFILGLKAIMKKAKQEDKPEIKKNVSAVSFRQAVLIELLNPKTALFFLAFLPQFVRNDGTPVVLQLSILGMTFVIMSLLYTTFLAAVVDSIGKKLIAKKGPGFNWQDKLVGLVYIGLGVRLVFQTQE